MTVLHRKGATGRVRVCLRFCGLGICRRFRNGRWTSGHSAGGRRGRRHRRVGGGRETASRGASTYGEPDAPAFRLDCRVSEA